LEVGLWVVLLNSLFVAWTIYRRSGRAEFGYVLLLAGNGLLAGYLLGADVANSVWAVISIGVFVFTVMVPPWVAKMVERAVYRDQIHRALRLHTLQALLQPGRNWADSREMLTRFGLIQSGRSQDVVDELLRLRTEVPKDDQVAVDAQVVHTLTMARRWEDAIKYFEAHLPFDLLAFDVLLAARMIRAYGEVGQCEGLLHAMELLEDSPAADSSSEVLSQARLMFLAFCGKQEEVEELLRPRSGFAQSLPDGLRWFWTAVARKKAGNVDGARSAFDKASQMVVGTWSRQGLVRQSEELDAGTWPAACEGEELIDQVLTRARRQAGLPRVRGGRWWRIAPVTMLLVLVASLVWGLTMVVGDGEVSGRVLIMLGGNLRPAVTQGQWYRLVTSIFLHGHWLHMGLNLLVLAILGRLAEQMMGSYRYLTVFLVAGVAGSLASYWAGTAPLSVGSSGAIFGLIGAMIAQLKLDRDHWPEFWARSMTMLLLLVAGLSLLPGLTMKVIDNWAHLGGLMGGALAAAFLVRVPPKGHVALSAGVVSIVVMIAAGIWAGWAALRPLPNRIVQSEGVSVSLPATWMASSPGRDLAGFFDLATESKILVYERPVVGPAVSTKVLLDAEAVSLRKDSEGFEIAFLSHGRSCKVRLPPGWSGRVLWYRRKGSVHVHGIYVRLGKATNLVVHVDGLSRFASQVCPMVSGVLSSIRIEKSSKSR